MWQIQNNSLLLETTEHFDPDPYWVTTKPNLLKIINGIRWDTHTHTHTQRQGSEFINHLTKFEEWGSQTRQTQQGDLIHGFIYFQTNKSRLKWKRFTTDYLCVLFVGDSVNISITWRTGKKYKRKLWKFIVGKLIYTYIDWWGFPLSSTGVQTSVNDET
jgi:hypothetical protein